ncbi:hypothetical protein [Streptomyces microflavus]|uniref:hypothetical protein n=1 Tax=Streptomyces microflavus TaxID=1919 RepID=UPI003B20F2A8
MGRAACLLAIDLQADAFVVEANFGGDMAAQILRQAWAELERKGLTGGMLMPRIIEVTAKVGKGSALSLSRSSTRTGTFTTSVSSPDSRSSTCPGSPAWTHRTAWTPPCTC